ncbi:MAG: sugar transferase [Actinomycetota bacterium]|nr:sugar transferase [Actinomycetota bacterium]
MAQTAPTADPEQTEARQPLQRRSARRIALRMVADGMAVSAGLFTASAIRFELMTGSPAPDLDYTLITVLGTPVVILLFWLYGLYEPRQVLSPVNEFKQVFHGVVAGGALLFIFDSVLSLKLARGWVFIALLSGLVIVGGERLAVRKTLHFLRRRGGDVTRTIVLGANQEARAIARTLEREGWLGYSIIGFVDDQQPVGHEVSDGHEVIGRTSDLTDLVRAHQATLVLVAASAFDTSRLNRLFWELQDVDIDLQITSGTVDLLASRMVVQSVAGVPLLYVKRPGMDKLQRTFKRTTDVIGSLSGLILLSPLLVLMALWIKLDSKGHVFFKQERVGRDGKRFTLWKFRTMIEDAEQRRAELEHLSEGPGLLFKLKEDPRVTSAGKRLRRYSLDELAQLWNVLRGDMSLVGPRPALPSEVEQYDDWIRNRLRVKPGITGLWQVSGRTETSFSDYVRHDLFYIQNWSFSLDLWILWRTLRAVISAEGAH